MDKSLITHGVWLAIAATAFAGGMAIKGGDSKQNPSAPDTTAPGLGGLSALNPSTSKKGSNAGGTNEAEGSSGAGGFTATKSTTALLADYLTSNDKLEQNYLFAQLLLSLSPENAAQVYESLKGKLTGREGGQQMSLFFQAWGKIDGESAIAAASEGGIEMGRGGGNGFNVGGVLAGWASSDPEAAKSWLNELEDDRSKGFLTFGLVNGLVQSDPNAATEYVMELAAAQEASGEAPQTPWGGSFTSRYIGMIAEEQLKQGTGVATNWAEGLPEGDMKNAAFDKIAEDLSRSDIEGAKSWVAEHAGEDYAKDAIREVAEQMARTSPQDALTWADTLPANAQPAAYSEAMERWTREDAAGAAQHLYGMSSSPSRDAAVESFATSLARERDEEKRDPESAATWAASIDNEELRISTLTEVGQSWMRSDREAATAWLPTSGLSQEAQAKVAEPQRGGGGFDFRRGGR